MIKCLHEFRDRFINNEIKFRNEKLNQIIQSYSLYLISEKQDLSLINEEISQNIKESEVIIINKIKEDHQKVETQFILIIFKHTIIIIQQFFLSLLKNLFQYNDNLTILFLSETRETFDKLIPLKYKNYEMNEQLDDCYLAIKKYFVLMSKESQTTRKICKAIKDSISIFMIIHSYHKLNRNRIEIFNSEENDRFPTENININDFIEIRAIKSGYSAAGTLIYHIEKEEFLLWKKVILQNEEEADIVKKREIKNYMKMKHHPFIPKFYGTIKGNKGIVIEFINGKTLYDIERIQLTENDRLTIIFELLIVFQFLHQHHFIYRDLKPDNIMIDQNKSIVLIDFDRMLNSDDFQESTQFTTDFISNFMAPEVFEGNFSYECDIYSLGLMIYYIMKEKIPFIESQVEDFGKHSIIKEMFEKCTKENPKERPLISELISEFYINYQSQIQINKSIENFLDIESIIKNQKEKEIKEAEELNDLGEKYIYGINCKQDAIKGIQYFKLSADKNCAKAQLNLAHVYYEIYHDKDEAIRYFIMAAEQHYDEAEYELGKLYYYGEIVKKDLNKAIDYLTRSANQDYPKSLLLLGQIYKDGIYVNRDINKVIKYFTKAANLGNVNAQIYIAILYRDGEIVQHDINKSIHYFELAANKSNNSEAQFNLGILYLNGDGVQKDIQKAIDYFTRSANQNHYKSQYNLALIYYSGEFIKKDINKAINYFTFAANNNNVEAQFILGLIYCEGQGVPIDYNKGVYYFTLAANQNHSKAQFNLGSIYLSGQHISRDIDKAIYYYNLAAKQNHLQAQINLGSIYLHGNVTFRDINKSIFYFTLAANQNCAEAQFTLGKIYYDNEFIKQDINKSIQFLTRAADQFHLKAIIYLADIYHIGKYVKRDSNKAIYYYNLAAKQNDPTSLFNLGVIYYKGNEVPRDINRAIYYLNLSADLNCSLAQYNLGFIYYKGKYKEAPRDINKAIHYFTLASKNHQQLADFALGYIYLNEKSIKQDLNKAIFYLSKAATNNISDAIYWLGWSYYLLQPDNPDINKIIQCFTLAAKKDNSEALIYLGIIFYEGLLIKKDNEKAIKYLTMASKSNENHQACFCLGFIYQENVNYEKAISYYKESSLILENYSRNNLGVIYKNENIEYAIHLFNENIQYKNDELSMYNLAHIYLYDKQNEDKINKSIELLIKSIEKGFYQSIELLCLALIKKVGYEIEIEKIKKEIEKYSTKSNEILKRVSKTIKSKQLNLHNRLMKQISFYENIDFLYDYLLNPIMSNELVVNKSNQNQEIFDISAEFYEGFGF